MSASYDDSLSGATQDLAAARNSEQVKAIVVNAGDVHPRNARNQQGAGRPADRVRKRKSTIFSRALRRSGLKALPIRSPVSATENISIVRTEMAVQTALANGEPLSLLMFDIDHFKSFNDSYGHLTGDQVLRLVGMSLKQTSKGQDITARYGGEDSRWCCPTRRSARP